MVFYRSNREVMTTGQQLFRVYRPWYRQLIPAGAADMTSALAGEVLTAVVGRWDLLTEVESADTRAARQELAQIVPDTFLSL